MANIPGLSPFREDRPDVSRKGHGRVVLKDAGPQEMPRLRPTAQPVDTYTRPQRPVQDDSLKRLSESLASLNPALMRFGMAIAEDNKESEDAEFNKRATSMPVDELRQKALDRSDPIITRGLGKARGQQLFAARVVEDVSAKFTEEWASANKDGMDIETFITTKNKEVLDTYGGPGQEHFINEYTRLIGPKWAALRSAQVKHNAEKTNAENMQGAASLFQLTVDNGRAEGKSDDEIATMIRGEINGNRIMAGLDPRQQEAELLNQVQTWAANGEVGLVRAILNSKGTNGISLLANREHGAKATKLLELATMTAREKDRDSSFDETSAWYDAARKGALDRGALEAYHKKYPGRLSADQVRSLIAHNDRVIETNTEAAHKLQVDQTRKQKADDNTNSNRLERRHALATGDYWNIGATTSLKDNGDTVDVSPEENRKLAVKELLEDSRKIAEKNKETPQQRVERELPIVMANGFVHEEWKDTLATGYRSASAATLSGGKPTPALEAAQDLYNTLNARAPNLLPDLLGKESGDFYEYVRVATQEMQLPLDQANSVVLQLTKDPVKLHALKNGPTPKEVENAVRGMSDVKRPGYVMDEIATMTMIYSGLGLSEKEAVTKAKEQFEKTHVNINGNYIPRHDRNLPPDFQELVGKKLQAYAEKYGKAEDLDADDLTIQPSTRGTGAWEITTTHGLPVAQVRDRHFTLRDLTALKQQLNAEKAEKVAQEAAKKERRSKMLRSWADGKGMLDPESKNWLERINNGGK